MTPSVSPKLNMHNPTVVSDSGNFRIQCTGQFNASSGQRFAIVGESGCGKSTLLRAIAGLAKTVNGERMPPVDRKTVGFLTQHPVLFEHLTARKNLDLPSQFFELGQSNGQFDQAFALQVAQRLKLEEALDRSDVTDLSGGERQRLALARVLSTRPVLLLLDEPTTGLDGVVRKALKQELRSYAETHREAYMLVVTHHFKEMQDFFTDILWMQAVGRSASGIRPNDAKKTAQELSVTLTQFAIEKLDEMTGRNPDLASLLS